MYSKYPELIQKFNFCLDAECYYDAHEALEEIWFPRRYENSPEMNLLKGFINAAVSFELSKRGRTEPSKRAWKTYLKYRPLLYKITSPHLNDYHTLARKIELLKYYKTT